MIESGLHFLDTLSRLIEFSISMRDLNAQESMALWAKLMTLVSLLGTVAVLISLYFAHKNISVAREIGRDQNRAYVEVIGCDVGHLGERRGQTGSINVEGLGILVSVKNCGLTPALEFSCSGSVFVRKYEQDGYVDHMKCDTKKTANWSQVASGQVRTFGEDQEEIIQAIHWAADNDKSKDYRTALAFIGKLQYTTIYKEVRETPFSFILDGKDIHYFRNDLRLKKSRLIDAAPSKVSMKYSTTRLAKSILN